MSNWLAAAAKANPQKIALIAQDTRWTYTELHQRTVLLSQRLTAIGVKQGDHVGVLLSNCPEYVLLIHALARLDAVLVPLNTRLTADELLWQVQRAKCVKVICADSSKLAVLGDLVVLLDDLAALDLTAASAFSEQQFTADADSSALSRTQAIIFTSGTTGRPKGAQITFGNHFWSAAASSWRMGVLPEDRWLLTLPLYHVGGLSIVFRSALYGTAIVLHDGFEVARAWAALETHKITLVSLVPTMLYRLLEARPDTPFPPSVRIVLLGGAAASLDLVARCTALNIPIATTYGLTEAASQVATMLPEDVRRKPDSVGKPLMFTSVRIADEQGNTLPSGEHGEIVVRGPTVMQGYYDEPQNNTLRNGELYTGDMGYLDDDGDLWVVQRRSDLIISGGENIYPAEVENVLRQHPAVADVCVIGLSSETWGQQVAAAVVFKSSASATIEELDTFCRQRLAGYKCPRKYVFVTELPQTASGKVSRRQVIAAFEG